MVSELFGNNLATIRFFNRKNGFLESIQTFDLLNAPTGQNLSVTFDKIGNLTAREDYLRGFHESFGYDNLNRLYYAFQGANTWDYSIDGGGDRISSNESGAFSALSYDLGTHRLNSVSGAIERSYTYDAAGNTRTDGMRTWVYGGNGRPAQGTSGGITTGYAFNALGQRVKKFSGQGGTHFF